MSDSTQEAIDTTRTNGEYQPLAAYPCEYLPGGWVGTSREECRAVVEAALVRAGFRLFDGTWYSRTHCARIGTDLPQSAGRIGQVAVGTIGVTIRPPAHRAVLTFANHMLDGTYDDLSPEEKYRISGSSMTFEGWCEEMRRCGRRV